MCYFCNPEAEKKGLDNKLKTNKMKKKCYESPKLSIMVMESNAIICSSNDSAKGNINAGNMENGGDLEVSSPWDSDNTTK